MITQECTWWKHNALLDSCSSAHGLLEVSLLAIDLRCTAVSKALVSFLLSGHFFTCAVKMHLSCCEPNNGVLEK